MCLKTTLMLHTITSYTLTDFGNFWQILSKLVDECRRYSKPKQCHFWDFQHDWKDPISGVHVSPGNAETLIRRGGITNHHWIAYSLSNISSKNYHNRSVCIEVIVCNVNIFFLRRSVVVLFCSSVAWSLNLVEFRDFFTYSDCSYYCLGCSVSVLVVSVCFFRNICLLSRLALSSCILFLWLLLLFIKVLFSHY